MERDDAIFAFQGAIDFSYEDDSLDYIGWNTVIRNNTPSFFFTGDISDEEGSPHYISSETEEERRNWLPTPRNGLISSETQEECKNWLPTPKNVLISSETAEECRNWLPTPKNGVFGGAAALPTARSKSSFESDSSEAYIPSAAKVADPPAEAFARNETEKATTNKLVGDVKCYKGLVISCRKVTEALQFKKEIRLSNFLANLH